MQCVFAFIVDSLWAYGPVRRESPGPRSLRLATRIMVPAIRVSSRRHHHHRASGPPDAPVELCRYISRLLCVSALPGRMTTAAVVFGGFRRERTGGCLVVEGGTHFSSSCSIAHRCPCYTLCSSHCRRRRASGFLPARAGLELPACRADREDVRVSSTVVAHAHLHTHAPKPPNSAETKSRCRRRHRFLVL